MGNGWLMRPGSSVLELTMHQFEEGPAHAQYPKRNMRVSCRLPRLVPARAAVAAACWRQPMLLPATVALLLLPVASSLRAATLGSFSAFAALLAAGRRH